MTDFMIRFFICNLWISGIITILLILKKVLKNNLTARMQYHLWFLLPGLLVVPFLPIRLRGFSQILPWFHRFHKISLSDNENVLNTATAPLPPELSGWMNDFTLSVSRKTPSIFGAILFGIWMTGILVMLVFVTRSILRLHTLKKTALPLQNLQIQKIYDNCLSEMHLTAKIPVFSTVFLKSPVIVGFFKPCIYLPSHLISDYKASELRYMLLHELQHYKHKDALINYLFTLVGIFYWLNPVIWYAFWEMRNDREVACDTSVLEMLNEDAYEEYGNTLINFAEKLSFGSFPFTAGLVGNKKQIKRRIINIASYEKPSFWKQVRGMIAFSAASVLLLGCAPILSTYATEGNLYKWNPSDKNISDVDLSEYFGDYKGSFVLYDLEQDHWSIFDIPHAVTQVSPDSTYKLYDALFALEEQVISPEQSFLAWDHKSYPFEAWNKDQTLQSAMTASVNWYFQSLDRILGKSRVESYIQEIGYGNEDVSGDLSSYWLESSLKISPVEQVELLVSMYRNDFDFSPENIQAVTDSIRLSSSVSGTLYGKTGTGQVDGQTINGWFIGFVESTGHTCFFAANIRADSGASGSNASEITLNILSDMDIWK